jgi:DNA topoisomerase-1
MRTDSVNLAEKFLTQAQQFINKNFGSNYHPGQPRHFKTKSKSAQEAHEAIRPTDVNLMPDEIKTYLNKNQLKLYQLIWQRAVASQMSPAQIQATILDVQDHSQKYIFRANGSVIKFDGFLKVYPTKTQENILPELKLKQPVDLVKFNPQQHFTQPPARYTEASLVKTLEQFDIGRPSTYAQIINTIQQRNYVTKEQRYLIPTEIGTLVNKVLVEHFNQIVDYDFTAQMENELDDIAQGKLNWVKAIQKFYQPFINNIQIKEQELDKTQITQQETTDIKCPKCGNPMMIKLGRFGKFLACSNFPECKTTQPLEENGPTEEINEKCPECGHDLKIKFGRFGKFLACSNYPECKFTKPIIKSTGVKCPECGQGELVEKRTKTKRTFYACSNYPKCKFALWSKPNGEKCPQCGSLLIYGTQDTLRCSHKDCKFTKKIN